MSIEKGKELVTYSRKSIENHVRGGLSLSLENYHEKAGVFVSIHTYPSKRLRGCIGIPEAIYSLRKAIQQASISACHDPRFPELEEKELGHIIIEITVLTPPQILQCDPADYPKNIHIGKDGLIVEKNEHRGLLLPQVAVEYNWTEELFLNQTCIKAGLAPGAWNKTDTTIYKFQGEIFSETSPNGDIIKVNL